MPWDEFWTIFFQVCIGAFGIFICAVIASAAFGQFRSDPEIALGTKFKYFGRVFTVTSIDSRDHAGTGCTIRFTRLDVSDWEKSNEDA